MLEEINPKEFQHSHFLFIFKAFRSYRYRLVLWEIYLKELKHSHFLYIYIARIQLYIDVLLCWRKFTPTILQHSQLLYIYNYRFDFVLMSSCAGGNLPQRIATDMHTCKDFKVGNL